MTGKELKNIVNNSGIKIKDLVKVSNIPEPTLYSLYKKDLIKPHYIEKLKFVIEKYSTMTETISTLSEPPVEYIRTITPEFIKSLRGKYDMSQDKFAEELGIATVTLSRIEQGNLDISQRIKDNVNAFIVRMQSESEKEKPLHEYLTALRKEKLKTQEEISSYLGIERNAYAHYETGTIAPPIEVLQKLSKLYKIRLGDLTRLLPPDNFAKALNRFNQESNPEINTKLHDKLEAALRQVAEEKERLIIEKDKRINEKDKTIALLEIVMMPEVKKLLPAGLKISASVIA